MGNSLKFPEKVATERLLLRKPVVEDAARIFKAYAADPEVVRFLTWEAHNNADETSEFISVCLAEWEENRKWPYVITKGEIPEAPIGMIHLEQKSHEISTGYVLAKPFWGQGIITEAFRALIDICFSKDGIYRISAFCDVENVGSARVMEKAGLAFEGVLKRHTVAPALSSEPRDCRLYARVR